MKMKVQLLMIVAVSMGTVLCTGSAQGQNLALNRQVTASALEAVGLEPEKAVDGNTGTRWASQKVADLQWIYVDLGATYDVNRVVLNWEAAYAVEYQIQVSSDANTWTDIYSTTDGNGGIDDLAVSGTGRYIRMFGTKRFRPSWGYSLWEFEVYGSPHTTPPSPNPMTWATVPYATSENSIEMEATTASDVSGVEYYFTCTAGASHDSDWQDSTFYKDTGLSPSTTYTYTVKARDRSTNQNETASSTAESATTAPPDTAPPTPNPLTWAVAPYSASEGSIAMQATTATDPAGVEYYFTCTVGAGHDSGWQDSSEYKDTGLTSSTSYTYTVKARDKSQNQNETGASTAESATTDAPDTVAPSPDPMTWASVPYATGHTSIAMQATAASDPTGVEYYFTCTAGAGYDSGWQDSPHYEDTGLDPNTQYTYTVQARDKSIAQNQTLDSTAESAATPPGAGVLLLYDGFETADWDAKWDDIPHNWLKDSTTFYEGSASAHADRYNYGFFICDDLDASDANTIYVSFWFMKDDIDPDEDFLLYYFDGTTYNFIADFETLGDDAVWLSYSDTITDPNYFVSDFRIRFSGVSEGPREKVWLDSVLITKNVTATPCDKANLNGAAPVNFKDFAILAKDWKKTGSGLAGDITEDGSVDLEDLAEIVEYWLSDCSQP